MNVCLYLVIATSGTPLHHCSELWPSVNECTRRWQRRIHPNLCSRSCSALLLVIPPPEDASESAQVEGQAHQAWMWYPSGALVKLAPFPPFSCLPTGCSSVYGPSCPKRKGECKRGFKPPVFPSPQSCSKHGDRAEQEWGPESVHLFPGNVPRT